MPVSYTHLDVYKRQELNISCPNVKQGGIAYGIRPDSAKEVVSRVKAVCKKPLVVKLSPQAEDIARMAEACVEAGADALSLVNTFQACAIDIERRKPVFNNLFAGLSGPAVKPIALRMVWQAVGAVDVPVIGLGGRNIGTLRLWQAESEEELNFRLFNEQKYAQASAMKNRAEDITKVLYPNDTLRAGKQMRIKQQYLSLIHI